MPVSSLPIAAVSPGNVLTSTNWNAIVKDNLNKLLSTGHRVLTVAQFGALTGLEGTKGTVAPDEVYLEVDSANGVQWHLAYESGEATYKWRFLGGPPLFATGTSATTGVIAPRGGDYNVDWAADATATSLFWQDILTTTSGALSGNIAAQMTDGASGIRDTLSGFGKAAGVSASATIAHGISGHSTIGSATIRITPTRLV